MNLLGLAQTHFVGLGISSGGGLCAGMHFRNESGANDSGAPEACQCGFGELSMVTQATRPPPCEAAEDWRWPTVLAFVGLPPRQGHWPSDDRKSAGFSEDLGYFPDIGQAGSRGARQRLGNAVLAR